MTDAPLRQKESELLSEEMKSLCVACKREIQKNATICSECKSYQAKWKNNLQYFAGTASLLAVAAAAATWFFGALNHTFGPDDVRLIAANSQGSAVVANFGSRDVFISHLFMQMAGRSTNWATRVAVFNEKLTSGQFAQHTFQGTADMETPYVIIRGIADTEFENRVTRAVNNDNCFKLVFYSTNDSNFIEIKQMAGNTLNTFPISGYLQYWGIGGRSGNWLQIDGVGVLWESSRPECTVPYPIPPVAASPTPSR